MKQIARWILVIVFVAALAPTGTAAASDPPADPVCAQAAEALGATYESIFLDGAVTCTMYPVRWNRDVVVFAHGYEDARQAIAIPWGQLNQTSPSLPELVLKLGYAFSTTSYSKNGLAIKEGLTDVVKLVKHIREVKTTVRRVFLTGASEGGAITALAIERYPALFAGALSTCGPIGSFQAQVQYWGDFRVAFDKSFPNVLAAPFDPINNVQPYGASTPIAIDPGVVQNWEMVRDTYVLGWLSANPTSVEQLLTETKVPIDINDPVNTAGESILGLLYYNVEATNDARTTLVPGADIAPPSLAGNPYSNPLYTLLYPGGILPDPVASAEIQANYETSGKLQRQLVVMHTTGDPIVPFSQSLLYTKKAAAQRSLGKLAMIPVNRYGHCNFTAAEIVFGFYIMVLRSTLLPFSSTQIQAALPDRKARSEFSRMKSQFRSRSGR